MIKIFTRYSMLSFALLLAFLAAPSQAKFGPFSMASPSHRHVDHSYKPTGLWASTHAPLETNSWFEDFVIGHGNNKVNLYPYIVQAKTSGLEVCGKIDFVHTSTYVYNNFYADWTLTSTEGVSYRKISNPGKLHVDVDFTMHGGGSMKTPLVKGMAYITAEYSHATPRLNTIRSVVSAKANG